MKKPFIIILIASIIAIVTFFVINKMNIDESKINIAEISGRPVTIKEYRLYLYEEKIRFEERGGGKGIWEVSFDGISAENTAKKNALESLELVKISVIEAEKRNMSLSEEELKNTDEIQQALLSNVSPEVIEFLDISDEELKIILHESMLYLHLFNEITKNVEVNNDLYKTEFISYLEEEKQKLNDVKISYIYLKNYEEVNGKKIYFDENMNKEIEKKANGLLNEISAGHDFYDLIRNNSDDYNALLDSVIDKPVSGFDIDIVEASYKLTEKDVSDVIETDNGYYIIKLENSFPDYIKDKEEDIKEYYDFVQKQEVFDLEYKGWKKNNQTTINNEVWNGVKISDFDNF